MAKNIFKTLLIIICLSLSLSFVTSCSEEDNTSSSVDTSSKGGIILKNVSYSTVTYWQAVDNDTGLAYYSAIAYPVSAGASSATVLVPGNKSYYIEYKNGSGNHYTQKFNVTAGDTSIITVY